MQSQNVLAVRGKSSPLLEEMWVAMSWTLWKVKSECPHPSSQTHPELREDIRSLGSHVPGLLSDLTTFLTEHICSSALASFYSVTLPLSTLHTHVRVTPEKRWDIPPGTYSTREPTHTLPGLSGMWPASPQCSDFFQIWLKGL